ncbi:membrane protein insertase YidC [Halalkalibacter akibai]|uniref:Membrane protein insertase YidC n=1 Tax=Halalkalibacter akibai (strain ATCC 43226 / DSM 21942 / CIP 109018 / JCM 9157 / 1139) TaxID=1236973 RepID=W4QUA4_HALA3|nr:membrane protein insertase YidC [Halalkalibacter akibai]GAE35666.1 inner membrane protein translocase component YidC [Halalkalibacter akibai JCM 9157]
MKKNIVFMLIICMALLLTACGVTEQVPITAETQGVWNHFFVYPMSWLLIYVAELFNGSYGLSIILVTITIRLCLLPLVLKQQKSTRAMQLLKPEMEKLQNKYKEASKKDPAKQQEMQKELFALYKSNGVNPMAGCLPLFVQMPVLMAFYFAIIRTEQIALHNFLWFDLGNPDPMYILPLVAGLTTFIQVKMTSAQLTEQMKIIIYIMPVMIIVAGVTLPAALSLYWVVGNVFMIIQTYFTVTKFEQQPAQVSKV